MAVKTFLHKHSPLKSLEQHVADLLQAHPDVTAEQMIRIMRRKGGWEDAVAEGGVVETQEEDVHHGGVGGGDGQWAYFFGGEDTEGSADMKEVLGGKGAHLAQMCRLGCPVPPGFTLTTEVCAYFSQHGGEYPTDLKCQVDSRLKKLEGVVGKRFGDLKDPLLLSVRSGAAVSMPGMMDTVLNLGLNDSSVEGLAEISNNPRFAWDSYRRFIQMYGNVVKGIDGEFFEANLEKVKKGKGVQNDTELDVDDLKVIVVDHKAVYEKHVGVIFPSDPHEQLWGAVKAVFSSWNNTRAIKYREINDIKGLLGTAVNVQIMVFGNMGSESATGVCFSRNPSTGESAFYGEYLVNAQGEDVVAGIRTPQQITLEGSKKWAESNGVPEEVRAKDYPSMEERMPVLYKELFQIKDMLETHYTDMQDMEYTVQQGKLYMLQTRTGKRTAHAAVRIAVEMVHEGLINERIAISRVNPKQLDQLLHPMVDPSAKIDVLTRGLPASPGAAVGQIVFTAADAEKWVSEGKDVILVRLETSPEDISGMNVAKGILTSRGGMTSHAAVVARGMGTPCVAGCSELSVEASQCMIRDEVLKEGDWISLNGNTGDVIRGKVPLVEASMTGSFGDLMNWCSRYRKMKVRVNADTPHDAEVAMRFGAEGVGLCRTEHMFFEKTRIDVVREMILAENVEGRQQALKKLLPMQRGDFIGIFTAMQGKPVTVRLLDPPLHEFVPHTGLGELAMTMGVSEAAVERRVKQLHEANPMLGHRGCRLGITFPEIYDMQVRAILEAALEVRKGGTAVAPPEIMVPLIGKVEEFVILKNRAIGVADTVFSEQGGSRIPYRLGTMIEVPRAALTAGSIAKEAEFFSFGTNDLTQMGCGFSRDDSAAFLLEYIKQGIYEKDPFQSIDQEGVGRLIKMAVREGREVRRRLKCGICGEHGGDPSSVAFCHDVGLDYVSCSPYRVPIAMLAAAQAALERDE